MAVKQQQFLNSCGAASLLCAAHELGVANIPAYEPALLWAMQVPLALDNACEARLYQVCCNQLDGANPANWGYSMPSKVIFCAQLLGLEAWAVAHDTWTIGALKLVYGVELERLRQMGALVEIGSRRSTFAPGPNERELKVLTAWGALHYVMVRPDGTVMEPGQGQNHPNVTAAKNTIHMRGTGLSVFVAR